MARDEVEALQAELAATREANEAIQKQQRTLIEAQARLRQVAEESHRATRDELERLAEAICPDLVDELRKADPGGVAQVPARELVDGVIQRVQRRLAQLGVVEVAGQSMEELYERSTAQIARLEGENAQMDAELQDLRRERDDLALRLAVLQQSHADTQQRLGEGAGKEPVEAFSGKGASPIFSQAAANGAPVPSDQWPEWMQEWQRQQTFEKDRALVQVLAETGVARRKDATDIVASQLGIEPSSGTINRIYKRCGPKLELIDLIEATSGTRGSSVHHLLCLTQKGRDACRLLFGQDPAPSQTAELLRRHKSPEHALLNLEAGDLLAEAGYNPDLFPTEIELPGGGLYVPDIVANDGRLRFIECERDTRKNVPERDRKWEGYYTASSGEFYIIVPDRGALETIQSEVLFWAGTRPLVLWMTSISDARGKKGENVWLSKRGRPR